jgi:hypothetical protein
MLTRIRLTLKQHRFETLAISIVCLGLAAAALIEAFRLNSLGVPLSCFSTGQSGPYGGMAVMAGNTDAHCMDLQNSFSSIQYGMDMALVRMLLLLVPLVAGIIFGAPLVAREIEQGTAPLSWALAGSRRRWLLGKVLAGVVLLVPMMLVIGFAAEVLEGALDPGMDTHAIFQNYMGRGFIEVFWALAAFAGTFTLGTLFGRTMPAVVVALIVCLFVRVAWEPVMASEILRPMAVEDVNTNQPYSGFVIKPTEAPSASVVPSETPSGTAVPSQTPGGTNAQPTPFVPWWVQTNLYSYTQVFLDGKPYYGDPWQLPGAQIEFDANGNPIMPDPATMPVWTSYSIPGSQYWLVLALESGMLLLGSLLFAAIAFAWVDRRRPY